MQYFDNYPPVTDESNPYILGEKPYIHDTCKIVNSHIGAWTALRQDTTIIESTFGDYSYTDGNVMMIYTEVGKYCSIANSVRINPSNHPHWRVTQHHMTYRRRDFGLDTVDDHEFFDWRKEHKCVIGHDVWIGHGAIIMPGVSVGTGAVIGSGAIVTKDVGPYEIAVGVAATVIKKRFNDETIEKLLASEWWDWDREKLENDFKDLLDVASFINKYSS